MFKDNCQLVQFKKNNWLHSKTQVVWMFRTNTVLQSITKCILI